MAEDQAEEFARRVNDALEREAGNVRTLLEEIDRRRRRRRSRVATLHPPRTNSCCASCAGRLAP